MFQRLMETRANPVCEGSFFRNLSFMELERLLGHGAGVTQLTEKGLAPTKAAAQKLHATMSELKQELSAGVDKQREQVIANINQVGQLLWKVSFLAPAMCALVVARRSGGAC